MKPSSSSISFIYFTDQKPDHIKFVSSKMASHKGPATQSVGTSVSPDPINLGQSGRE